ncbi:MAG TPA: hypothetical protein VFT12_02545 [Thermoanaerobaculia bacterium]|nr:hypothetical protein [Thermoanaerobaculia bacterium]
MRDETQDDHPSSLLPHPLNTIPHPLNIIAHLFARVLAGARITHVIVPKVLLVGCLRETADAPMLSRPFGEIARGLLVEHSGAD